MTTFVMAPKYQAQALIRPNQDMNGPSGIGALAGMASAVLGGGSSPTGGLSSLLSGAGSIGSGASDPQELIAIMQSFGFTDALLAENHLESKIAKPRTGLMLWLRGPRSRWKLYRTMQKRFECDFSMRTNILSIYFIDKDPNLARFVLGQYIDRLRAHLRREQVQVDKVVVDSLEEQAARSADPMMRAQLYAIVAQQLEQEKTAEMQVDFAFSVIDAPVVPDQIYSPRRFIDPFAAGVLMFLMIMAYLHLRDRYQSLKREMELGSPAPLSLEADAAQAKLADGAAHSIT